MKTFVIATLCCVLLNQANAEISSTDLPHLEGTPITAQQSEGGVWTLLDFAQLDGVVQWAWLEHSGAKAYVIYPSPAPSITFPDGRTINADAQQVVMVLVGAPLVEFTRFGGKVVLTGTEVSAYYSLTPRENSAQVTNYWLSDKSITIAGTYTGSLTGTITALQGTPFDDNFILDGAVTAAVEGMGGADHIIAPQAGTVPGFQCSPTGANAHLITEQIAAPNNQLCAPSLPVVGTSISPAIDGITVHPTPPTSSTASLPILDPVMDSSTPDTGTVDDNPALSGDNQPGSLPNEEENNLPVTLPEPQCTDLALTADKLPLSAPSQTCNAPIQHLNTPPSPLGSTPISEAPQRSDAVAVNKSGKSKGGSIDWAFGAALLLLGCIRTIPKSGLSFSQWRRNKAKSSL